MTDEQNDVGDLAREEREAAALNLITFLQGITRDDDFAAACGLMAGVLDEEIGKRRSAFRNAVEIGVAAKALKQAIAYR